MYIILWWMNFIEFFFGSDLWRHMCGKIYIERFKFKYQLKFKYHWNGGHAHKINTFFSGWRHWQRQITFNKIILAISITHTRAYKNQLKQHGGCACPFLCVPSHAPPIPSKFESFSMIHHTTSNVKLFVGRFSFRCIFFVHFNFYNIYLRCVQEVQNNKICAPPHARTREICQNEIYATLHSLSSCR